MLNRKNERNFYLMMFVINGKSLVEAANEFQISNSAARSVFVSELKRSAPLTLNGRNGNEDLPKWAAKNKELILSELRDIENAVNFLLERGYKIKNDRGQMLKLTGNPANETS